MPSALVNLPSYGTPVNGPVLVCPLRHFKPAPRMRRVHTDTKAHAMFAGHPFPGADDIFLIGPIFTEFHGWYLLS